MGYGNSVELGELSLKSATIIGDDTLARDEFIDLRKPSMQTPERRLLLAILHEAMLTIVKGRGGARDAMVWVRDGDEHPFSFIFCCEAVGWEASVIRGLLEALHAGTHRPTDRLANGIAAEVKRISRRNLRPFTDVQVMRWHTLRGVPPESVQNALAVLVEQGVLARAPFGKYVPATRRRA